MSRTKSIFWFAVCALIAVLALIVAVATIYLWPLVAAAFLYVIFRVFEIHPELPAYIGALVGIIAIVAVWWWHVRSNKQP